MVKKYKIYPNHKLSSNSIQQAVRLFELFSKTKEAQPIISSTYSISHKDETKFLENYEKDIKSAEMFLKFQNGATLCIKYHGDHTEITMTHPEDIDLEKIIELLD